MIVSKAIHLICRRDDGVNLNGLSPVTGERDQYRSCCWALSDAEATSLVGGWIYLHCKKSAASEFGGKILSVNQIEQEAAPGENRVVITFEARREGRDQAWRGANHGMAWTSGLIEPKLPHEVS